MTPLRTTVTLIFIIACILLGAGCISQPVSGNQTGNSNVTITPLTVTTTITTPIATPADVEKSLQALMAYKDNLTPAQQKIPTQLLELIDTNFPVTEKDRQNLKITMIARNQLIPADQAKAKFNISQSAGQLVGDQVYIYIYVNSPASTHIIDPCVTLVNGRDENYHFAVAWIDINNVETLAALPEVRYITVVEPASHG